MFFVGFLKIVSYHNNIVYVFIIIRNSKFIIVISIEHILVKICIKLDCGNGTSWYVSTRKGNLTQELIISLVDE